MVLAESVRISLILSMILGMTEGSRERITVTLRPGTVAAAKARAGGNVSSYIERLIMADAVADSVASHATWLASRPGYFEADEAERDTAA